MAIVLNLPFVVVPGHGIKSPEDLYITYRTCILPYHLDFTGARAGPVKLSNWPGILGL